MKKTMLVLSVVALFSACKKDYTCECTTSPGNSVDKHTINAVSKSRAKANCVSSSFEDNGTKIETNCTLK